MSDIEFEDSRGSNFSANTNLNRPPVMPVGFTPPQMQNRSSNAKGLTGKIMGWFNMSSEESANKVLLIVAGLFFALSAFFFFS